MVKYSNNTHFTTPKERVQYYYSDLVNRLSRGLNHVRKIEDSNDAIVDFRDHLLKKLDEQVKLVTKEAQKSINKMPWDKLMIAFFGETNAGKSTIIETFRILFDSHRKKNHDGLIVGDGRQDFTKEYHDYELKIEGKPFVLIDVPGIEGNESEFKEVIADALRRAHIIFYVQGHNKKPDEATAKKIKNYLSDWAKVYSIQNIRGSVSDYDEEEERETLLTPNVLKTEKLIKSKFKEILGDVYKGNIPLQALLSMCAKATFSNQRQDLIKKQRKLIRFFGTADKILEFSQFKTIVNLVDNLANHYTDEIVEANRTKLKALAKRANESISHVLSGEREQLDKFNQQLRDYRRDVRQITNSCTNCIFSRLSNKIEIDLNILKNKMSEIIKDKDLDDEGKRNASKQLLIQIRQDITSESHSIYEEEINKMHKMLDRKSNDLKGLIKITIDIPKFNPNLDIDIDGILEDLDINLDDVGNYALDVANVAGVGALVGNIIPGFGTAVGALIGGGIGLIGKALFSDDDDKKKAEAIRDLSKNISELELKINNELRNHKNSFAQKVKKEQSRMDQSIEKERGKIEYIINASEKISLDLVRFTKEI